MNRKDENVNPMQAERLEPIEPELREALGNFRASVTAWSEAMMTRPRAVEAPFRANWSIAAKWALGGAVFAGTISGGVYQNHRQVETARAEAAAAAERSAEQQRQLAAPAEREQSADDLMAKVDSDIAREVPSALEPMASLMTDEETKGN